MKAIATKKLYHVTIEYHIEAEDATSALDKVLGCHPLKPISFSCEPTDITIDEEDDEECA